MPTMRRRSYLALLAVSLGAGCLSDAGVGGKPDPDPSTSPERTPTETAGRAEEPFESVTVGDPVNVTDTENNRPHGVVVVNDGPRRSIVVDVNRGPPDHDPIRPALEETYEFPPGGWIRIELVEPAPYTVVVSVPESGQDRTFEVERGWFDCNYSTHQATVPASGRIELSNSSTTLACATVDDEETPVRTTGQTDGPGTEPATEGPLDTPTESTGTATN